MRQPSSTPRFCASLALLIALTGPAAAADTEPLEPTVAKIVADVSVQRIAKRIETLVGFHTRHTLSDTASDTRGIGAARRWIQRELQACSKAAGGRLQVEMDEFVEPAGRRVPTPATLVNVVATLPGTSAASKDRLLVVSGHYDSRNTDVMDASGFAPGANDDASGVAAVMELACVMAAHQFDATLVFMAVAGEEQGLLGATHWAKTARARNLRIEAMITNDIVGSATGDAGQYDPKQLRLFADGFDPLLRMLVKAQSNQQTTDTDSASEAVRRQLQALALAGGGEDLPTHQLGRHLKAAGERYVPGFTVNLIQRRDRYLRGGDHLPFLERGYAAVRFTEPFENFRHQHQDVRTENGVVYGDLVEFVDMPYLANVTRINAAGLATLALAPAAPQNVRLEAIALDNNSTLRWEANTEPGLKGYRVVWRETGSPVWQQHRDVGLVTRTTITGVSKDNVVFGVQAIGARGTASLASYPLPMGR
ncbi:MAG: M28 family metallopeptidase [Burkholderiaceae bacterium]|nr:M28 family metallopeptidase [Burkholderiaceae bacterium]